MQRNKIYRIYPNIFPFFNAKTITNSQSNSQEFLVGVGQPIPMANSLFDRFSYHKITTSNTLKQDPNPREKEKL